MPGGQTPQRNSGIPLVARVIATGLFVGYVPWASGTFGSFLGLLIILIPGVHAPLILLPLIVTVFFAGTASAWYIARVEGDTHTRTAELTKAIFQGTSEHAADPSIVVIDEIVGMWISLLWIPLSVPSIVIAFVLFRLFDILKPEPARTVERISYGFGIMLDDVVAGIYANLFTNALLYLLANILHVLT